MLVFLASHLCGESVPHHMVVFWAVNPLDMGITA